VASNLASPSTDLAGFFRGLERFSGALAPVAQTQASLFANLDTTFSALANVAPSLQGPISQTPPAFEAVISQSPVIRPFLTDTASLLAQLAPGIRTLQTTAPPLTEVFRTGTQNLPQSIPFDRRLATFSKTLGRVATNPTVQQGVGSLSYTAKQLQQPLAFLTPVQSTCNYVTLFLRNLASATSEHVPNGGILDFVPVATRVNGGQNLGFESQPSIKPYPGPPITSISTGSIGALHSDPYPNTASPGQVRECSAGNEPFDPNAIRIGNPPGDVGVKTEKTTRGSAG
jgi:hypothetical protein